jgi:hypothetical protein
MVILQMECSHSIFKNYLCTSGKRRGTKRKEQIGRVGGGDGDVGREEGAP